jgi:hypothetical protein
LPRVDLSHMDGSADGTLYDTIEEKKQYWVTILVISKRSRSQSRKKEGKIENLLFN